MWRVLMTYLVNTGLMQAATGLRGGEGERLQALPHPHRCCTLTRRWAAFHIQEKFKYTPAGGGETVLLLIAP